VKPDSANLNSLPAAIPESHIAFRILRPQGKGRFIIFCDHASNRVPAELENLGLPSSELDRHIAWDIGAAGVTAELSSLFDSPAILSCTSRLVIDCNRQLHARDLIPEVSDSTAVPGNQDLSEAARQLRIERFFDPYHAAVESVIADRESLGLASIALSVHSMTACLAGKVRPWQIALSSHNDRSLVEPMLEALRRPEDCQSGDVTVGDNQPYDLDPAVDYSTPFHAMRRNMPYLQVEFRQDEVTDTAGQVRWARRFADALAEVLRDSPGPRRS
jgi:predicted N-formylglutamate amidohydrolase